MCRWLKIQKEPTPNSRVSTFAPRPFSNARCAVPDARVWGRCFPPVSWFFFSFFSNALQRSVPAALLLCVTQRATAWHRAEADSTTLRDSLPAYNEPNGSSRTALLACWGHKSLVTIKNKTTQMNKDVMTKGFLYQCFWEKLQWKKLCSYGQTWWTEWRPLLVGKGLFWSPVIGFTVSTILSLQFVLNLGETIFGWEC